MIIVLGILAVIATPKFIGLSKEARIQTLSQVQASVKTVITLTYTAPNYLASKASDVSLQHNMLSIAKVDSLVIDKVANKS